MKVRLTRAEMVREWRLRHLMEPLSDECLTERTDGNGVDELTERIIDDWYLRLLDTADASLLPVEELKGEVVPRLLPDGSVVIKLPERVRRVVRVRLRGWLRDAELLGSDQVMKRRLQESEYVRGGSHLPTAIAGMGEVRLFSAQGAEAEVETIECVIEPEAGVYVMDRSLLERL